MKNKKSEDDSVASFFVGVVFSGLVAVIIWFVYFMYGTYFVETCKEFRYFSTNTISNTECRVNGKLHNDNGPAEVDYYLNEKIRTVYYYKNGVLHNDKGPAVILFDQTGHPVLFCFYDNGRPSIGNNVDCGNI